MNIQKRGAGLTLLLILIVGAAAAAATWWEDQSITRLIDAHTLQSMQSIQRFAESSQRRELELKTAILASNPGFVGYISQAISSGAESGGVVDAASIRDLLEERRNDNAFDAAAILDPAGKTVVMLGNSLRTQQDFSATSLWTRFRASTAPTIDLISYNGHLILVSLSPMLRGETLEAVLLTGVEVADSFVVPVARAGQVDLALIGLAAGGNTVIASTLGAEDHQVVLDAVAAEPSLPPAGGDSALRRDFDLRLSAGQTRASLAPLFASPSSGLLVSIVPVSARVVRSGAIRTPMLVAGAVVLIFIGLLWWFIQRGLLRPLGHLSEMSERILRGDIHVVARNVGSGDVSTIASAMNQALQGLRGYKEVVEKREAKS